MAKGKNFTYVIGLEGGAEEGPMTLADLQPLVRQQKVVGSTFIKRSDRAEWTTAADLPELKVRDVVQARPGETTVGQEIEKELYLRKVRSGVNWLFWIGALSLLNSGMALFGIGRTYAMGLGGAHLIGALSDHFGSTVIWIGLGANVFLALAFLVVGALAYHGRPWLLGPAIGVYVADTLLCVLFEMWVSVGLHGLALCFLIPALVASYGARGIELNWRLCIPHCVTAAILCGAGAGGFFFLQKALTPKPAPWAASAPAQWPQLSLANAAKFKGHTELDAGNAFFIRLRSGNVVVATAKHLLGEAGGVKPEVELSKLDSSLTQWQLNTRTATPGSAKVTGLYGSPENYAIFDWVLLKVASEDVIKLPAEPLLPRFTEVKKDEKIFLVGAGATGDAQEVHAATVERTDALGIIHANLHKPIDLVGFSGSPIVDEKGNLIGILTGSMAKPNKQGKLSSFTADQVLEIKGLLK